MSASSPFAPLPASDEEELRQLLAALTLSREEVEGSQGFELVDTAAATPPVATAKAGPKLTARPKALPRAQPRRYYVVTSVPEADLSKLGVHLGAWRQVGVPNGTLAGSGWTLRVFDSRQEATDFWNTSRPADECPYTEHPQQ